MTQFNNPNHYPVSSSELDLRGRWKDILEEGGEVVVVVDCGGWGRLSVGIGEPRLVGWIVYRVRKAVVVATGRCRGAGKAWKREKSWQAWVLR